MVPAQILHELEYLAWPGCINAIVGSSGAGKTLLLRAISGLLPDGAETSGAIGLDGETLSAKALAAARGTKLAYVPGSAGTALNPVRTVASQMRETLKVSGLPATAGDVNAALAEGGLGSELSRRYAHELSGGQAQRVNIARALMDEPNLLLADEPTSALDSHLSQEIIRLLRDITQELHTATVLVTHDRSLLTFADHVVEVKDGRVSKQDVNGA